MRTCQHCDGQFYRAGTKEYPFCSYQCFVANDGAKRAGRAAADAIMKKYGAKKDANHKEIMGALAPLVQVMDLSAAGHGMPDGFALIRGAIQFFDIKNPRTTYGRKGLNAVQRKWAESVPSVRVYLLYSVSEAIEFAKGNFDGLKYYCAAEEMKVAA